ncbi:hypothetical protein, partial, partial [Parasitella parasitica]
MKLYKLPLRLLDSTFESLSDPFRPSDLLHGASRSLTKSSPPGMDGLPYEILSLLCSHPDTLKLALRVYNEALSSSIFPHSWQETCLILLPKKGDLSQLKNWRLISSLINTDSKIFTRLINYRLMTHLVSKISTDQMGFMPHRFIGKQGIIPPCVQEIAIKTGSSTIGLLLDQEKAYDHFHLDYLRACMAAFNIPLTLINAIINLFSSTASTVNVSGFLSPSFQQGRGLRQGDPLSPLLFNIAFDPLLRAINNHHNITGFHLPIETNQPMTPSSPYPKEVLAYADDTLVFLRNPTEPKRYPYMATHINIGYPSFTTTVFIPHSWHDNTSTQPPTYLGYAICSNAIQRANFATSTIAMLRSYCQLRSSRSLSYRGRVTVINSFLLSKLWHVMRLFTFSQPEIKQLQQVAASFINKGAKLTRFSFDFLTKPIKQDGLKLLDPATQAQALHWRWVYPLLHPQQASPTLMPSLPVLRFTLDYVLSSSQYPSYHWSLCCSLPVAQSSLVDLVQYATSSDQSIHYHKTFISAMQLCPHVSTFPSWSSLFIPSPLPIHCHQPFNHPVQSFSNIPPFDISRVLIFSSSSTTPPYTWNFTTTH